MILIKPPPHYVWIGCPPHSPIHTPRQLKILSIHEKPTYIWLNETSDCSPGDTIGSDNGFSPVQCQAEIWTIISLILNRLYVYEVSHYGCVLNRISTATT